MLSFSNWDNLIRSVKSTTEFSIGNGHVLKGFPLKFEKYDNTMAMGTIYWNFSTEDYLTWFNYNVDRIAEVLLINVAGNIDEDILAYECKSGFWGEIEFLRN